MPENGTGGAPHGAAPLIIDTEALADRRPRRSRSAASALRAGIALAGAAFLLAALFGGTGGRLELPAPGVLGAALFLLGARLYAEARGWMALFEGTGCRRTLFHGFFASQLGKYVPGGVWQTIGRVGAAVEAGVCGDRAAAAVVVYLVAQLAAGASLGALALLFHATLPGWVAALAATGLLAPLLLRRQWLAALAARLPRLGERARAGLPSQAAVLRAAGAAAAALLASAAAFALLLNAAGGHDPAARALLTFALAWAVGLASPLPSGLGVREAVLIASLDSGAGVLLAASVTHRVVQMLAEAALFALSRARRAPLAATAGT